MQKKNLSLIHLIREPKEPVENAPALIMLHGYGSNEQDLFSFAQELPEDLFIISVRAPIALEPSGFAWFEIFWDDINGKFGDDQQALESREILVDFIDQAVAAYPIDPKRVSLVGFSQGTMLSFGVALSYPEKIKNVIGLSGYIIPDILIPSYKSKDFSHMSIYSSHGTVDQVIPVQWAQKTKPFLDELAIENTYSEFPVGHGVAPQNFKELVEWLKPRY